MLRIHVGLHHNMLMLVRIYVYAPDVKPFVCHIFLRYNIKMFYPETPLFSSLNSPSLRYLFKCFNSWYLSIQNSLKSRRTILPLILKCLLVSLKTCWQTKMFSFSTKYFYSYVAILKTLLFWNRGENIVKSNLWIMVN